MNVSLVSPQPPDPTLAFGLLPQPKALPIVQVVGGSPGGLANLHGLSSFLDAGRIRSQLIVPITSLPLLPTVAQGLSGPSLHQATSDTDIGIVGPGLKLTSDTQIILDKWLPQAGPTILTDEVVGLLKINSSLFDERNVHWLISLPGLVKMASSTNRKARLTPDGGVHNVARIMAAQAIRADWLAVYSHDRVYIWLPSEEILLHTPIAAGNSEQVIRNGLITLTLSLVYRRLSALSLETRWQVTLWTLQRLQASLTAHQQVAALSSALEAAAQE